MCWERSFDATLGLGSVWAIAREEQPEITHFIYVGTLLDEFPEGANNAQRADRPLRNRLETLQGYRRRDACYPGGIWQRGFRLRNGRTVYKHRRGRDDEDGEAPLRDPFRHIRATAVCGRE